MSSLTPSSEIDACRLWLTAYLERRARLANLDSTFSCPPECSRPGCKNQDLQVPVSLLDLWGAASRRGEPAEALFRRHYRLGLFLDGRHDRLFRLTLRVNKPCPFLTGDRCDLYPVRPLACMLFPEYLVNAGTLQAVAGQEQFRDYLCLGRSLELTPTRKRVLTELWALYERELLLSGYYLFSQGPCYLDGQDFLESPGLGGGEQEMKGRAGKNEGQPATQTHQQLEAYFQENFSHWPPFADLKEKIARLDRPQGVVELARLFQDKGLFRQLHRQAGGRAWVYSFRHGKPEGRWRVITRQEVKFF